MADETPRAAVTAAADDPEEPQEPAPAPVWAVPGDEVMAAAPQPEPPGDYLPPQDTNTPEPPAGLRAL